MMLLLSVMAVLILNMLIWAVIDGRRFARLAEQRNRLEAEKVRLLAERTRQAEQALKLRVDRHAGSSGRRPSKEELS